MSSVDLGLFGLDCFVTDKASSSLDEEIESLLNETHARNILTTWRTESDPPYSDHDYTYNYKFEDKGVKMEGGSAKAWIDEDEPPMGYGRGSVKVEHEDRHMNVNVSSSGQGTKTVILQIPKDIK